MSPFEFLVVYILIGAFIYRHGNEKSTPLVEFLTLFIWPVGVILDSISWALKRRNV